MKQFEISITATRRDLLSTVVQAKSEEDAIQKVHEAMDAVTEGPYTDVASLLLSDGQTVAVNHVDQLEDTFHLDAIGTFHQAATMVNRDAAQGPETTDRIGVLRTDAEMRYQEVRKQDRGYTMEADYHSASDNQMWQKMSVVAQDAESPVEIQCVSAWSNSTITITSSAIRAEASPDFDIYIHCCPRQTEI